MKRLPDRYETLGLISSTAKTTGLGNHPDQHSHGAQESAEFSKGSRILEKQNQGQGQQEGSVGKKH